jgi:2-polyprenyl-6-methoxyphenol hydroxylase-like FAD-dependent oxidoreductase
MFIPDIPAVDQKISSANMRILIIGGGIGGFSMYHALRKHFPESSTTIKIYEAYPSANVTKSNIGGGLGLAPNGLRALASLSKDIADDIVAHGLSEPIITLRNSSGKLVGRMSGGRKERYGFDQMLLSRAAVHDAVIKGVPDDAVEWQKKAQEVRETEDGVEVEFEDGTVEKGDLVIGADGVKSVVREAIFGDKYPVLYE